MLIANGTSVWNGIDDFICRKHNINNVIECMLFLESILNANEVWIITFYVLIFNIWKESKYIKFKRRARQSYLCIDFF